MMFFAARLTRVRLTSFTLGRHQKTKKKKVALFRAGSWRFHAHTLQFTFDTFKKELEFSDMGKHPTSAP